MPHNLLIDNWTLQNSGELICDGLDGDTAHDLVFTKSGNNFGYNKVSADMIRFEALSQFLTSIVFADELYVDANYADAWLHFEPIKKAHVAGIVIKKPFKDLAHEWIPAREAMADRLCVNQPMLKAHRANKRAFEKRGQTEDGMLSQLVWGGAGMLARADYFKLPYTPHPSRTRLFDRAKIVIESPRAADKLTAFISSERAKIYKRLGGGVVANIRVSPVVIQIIEESKDLDELVKTAIHLRDEYKKLRSWLGNLQKAFSGENTKEILAHNKELESVARNLEARSSLSPQGDTTLQFGVSWLKVGMKGGSPLNAFRNLFGMRAELNRLALQPTGHATLKKFSRMLGEQHTKTGMKFVEGLVERLSDSK